MPRRSGVMQLKVGETFNPYGWFTGSWMPEWLERRPELSHTAKAVYARLGRYMGRGTRAWPKQGVLADALGTSRAKIIRALDELEAHHLIQSIQRGLGMPNVYEFLVHEWMFEVPSEPEGDEYDEDDSELPEVPESVLPEVPQMNFRKSASGTTIGRQSREDSQGRQRSARDRRAFGGAVEPPDAPALGADEVTVKAVRERSGRPGTLATHGPAVASLTAEFVRRARDLDEVEVVLGKTAFVRAVREALINGAAEGDVLLMLDRFFANPDTYRKPGEALGTAFIRSRARLLDSAKRAARSTGDFDVSKSSSVENPWAV